MRWRRTQEGGSRHRGGCLYLPCILLLAMLFGCCAPLGGAYATLWAMKQDKPAAYRAFARDVFEISPRELGAEYFLTEEGRALAEEANLDPDLLALSLYTERWADEKWGEEYGDWSVYYVLSSEESAGCANCGKSDACTEYGKYSEAQCECLHELLARWKKADLLNNHSMGSKVEQYLSPDYSGALGSEGFQSETLGWVGGGALGCKQFVACTVLPFCDEIDGPCDLWDPPVAMKLGASKLHKDGWREDLPLLEAASVLMRWNHDRPWVTGIAEKAGALRASLGQVRASLRVKKAYTGQFETTEDVWVGFLGAVGLMPEGPRSPEGMAIVLDGEWQLPIHEETILTSDSKDHDDRCPIKFAWDFWQYPGTTVYPARSGVVNLASYGNEGGYGHWVKIDHGDGIETVYAHLGKLLVEVGQEVDVDTSLGGIARTGITDWPHTHFEVRKNGVQVDPAEIYGQPEEIGLPYVFWTQLSYERRQWTNEDGDE